MCHVTSRDYQWLQGVGAALQPRAMGNKATPLPRFAQLSNQLTRQRLRGLVCNPWTAFGLLLAYHLASRLLAPADVCPPRHLCVPNAVSGSPSATTPYIEYSEVTSSASVYRVSSKLRSVKTPYQLIEVYDSLFFGKILTIDGALMITERAVDC